MKHDVIIIGGGAAGLMCAIHAGRRGRRVLVLEHSERLGKKILISGGGRCNFTNASAGPDNYLSGNPDFCKSALARYSADAFIALVERHGIPYHEKKLGQLFCDLSSRQIVEMLQAECAEVRVAISLNCKVHAITKPAAFAVQTSAGVLECDSLVIATGGLSFPKIGATDLGYRVAGQFGLNIIPPRPGLVPLVFAAGDQHAFGDLSGISLEVSARGDGGCFRESILFTHRGLSGPAILQISNFWNEGGRIALDLLPDRAAKDVFAEFRQTGKELKNVLGQLLPQRFAEKWCERFAPSKPLNRFTAPELAAIASRLKHWEIQPRASEGYARAEVTLGGVATGELSSRTMESRKIPGLFFIGEVVDVTGWLGGYNFQWAWASGHAAGQAV